MKIFVSSAVGWGSTELSAFDKALIDTGVSNYNLIRLSSVLPPDSEVVELEGPVPPIPGSWGDRLYVVYAEMRQSNPGGEAWAGVGWVQDPESKKAYLLSTKATTKPLSVQTSRIHYETS